MEGGAPPSARELGRLLALRLAGRSSPGAAPSLPWLRVIRIEGHRAVVEISHRDLGAARLAWNGPLSESPHPPPGRSPWEVRTRMTWGTLKDAKLWLASRHDELRP